MPIGTGLGFMIRRLRVWTARYKIPDEFPLWLIILGLAIAIIGIVFIIWVSTVVHPSP